MLVLFVLLWIRSFYYSDVISLTLGLKSQAIRMFVQEFFGLTENKMFIVQQLPVDFAHQEPAMRQRLIAGRHRGFKKSGNDQHDIYVLSTQSDIIFPDYNQTAKKFNWRKRIIGVRAMVEKQYLHIENLMDMANMINTPIKR